MRYNPAEGANPAPGKSQQRDLPLDKSLLPPPAHPPAREHYFRLILWLTSLGVGLPTVGAQEPRTAIGVAGVTGQGTRSKLGRRKFLSEKVQAVWGVVQCGVGDCGLSKIDAASR
jgi:hypothetical protein